MQTTDTPGAFQFAFDSIRLPAFYMVAEHGENFQALFVEDSASEKSEIVSDDKAGDWIDDHFCNLPYSEWVTLEN